MRVSRSGAVRSAMSPHSKRLRSRSSSVRIAFGGPVGAQHDLLAILVDGVERVEELFLRSFLVRDELDVVDQQEVDPAVACPEVIDLALLDARDELVGELLGCGVDDALPRELGRDLVADGMHQVGLAEPDAAVQEERVVRVTRALRHRQAGRVGQAIGGPDDEVVEGIARVDVRGPALAADPGGFEADLCGGPDPRRCLGRIGRVRRPGSRLSESPRRRTRPGRCSRRSARGSG